MDNKTILEKFLKVEFPGSEFSDKEIEFLERFKIKNETESSVLKDVLGKSFTTVTAYYKKNERVERAKERLQERRNTFAARKEQDPDAFHSEEDPDAEPFAVFLDWWYSKAEEGGHICCYCGIDEKTCKLAFDKKILPSKKFTGTLHIERKDPDGGYNAENCDFACALCNNAKSDMITERDFNKYFKKSMRKYWKHIKKKLEKIEQ